MIINQLYRQPEMDMSHRFHAPRNLSSGFWLLTPGSLDSHGTKKTDLSQPETPS